jgi:membrane protein
MFSTARTHFRLAGKVVNDFSEDDCMTIAASIAYYTIFSLPPLLVIVIALAGAVWDESAVRGRIAGELRGVVGKSGAEQVDVMLDAANRRSSGLWATLVGSAVLLFGATGVMVQLQTALNRVFEVTPDPQKGGAWQFFRKRLLSLAMILAVTFLLIVSLVVTAALAMLGDRLSNYLAGSISRDILMSLDLAITLAIFTAIFAAMFKWLPDAKIRWRDVWVGAAVTAALFMIGKFAVGLYLGTQDPNVYGPAASLVLILIWVYYSAMILLFGAEFTRVWAERKGKRFLPVEGAIHQEGPHPHDHEE